MLKTGKKMQVYSTIYDGQSSYWHRNVTLGGISNQHETALFAHHQIQNRQRQEAVQLRGPLLLLRGALLTIKHQ